MKNTKLILIILVLIIFAGVSIFIIANNSKTISTQVIQVPPYAPAIVNSSASSVEQYTSAQVAVHSSSNDCWSIINSKVYNLTAWVNQHPGGQQAILSLCGIDGSSAFNDQHGGQKRPTNELASFLIGNLK